MKAISNQRGSVLIFATLMIVVLMILVGMGLDIGQLGYARNQGQAAVDAAALAAVSALPARDDSQVKARAKVFNSTNDFVGSATVANQISNASVSYIRYNFSSNDITNYNEPIATANGVRVAMEQAGSNKPITTPVFLTPLLNLLGISTASTQSTNVSAVSIIQAKPAIPIAMWESVCPQYPGPYTDSTITKSLDIKMQHPDQNAAGENSCWTTFLDCSSGAPDIKAGFDTAEECSGSAIDGAIGIGVPICQNRGQVNTVLSTAEEFFTANGGIPNSNWWIVPVIGGGGNCDPTNPSPIVTWAKIKPTGIVKTGNPKYITATIACGNDIQNELNVSLCYSHRLVREKAKNM